MDGRDAEALRCLTAHWLRDGIAIEPLTALAAFTGAALAAAGCVAWVWRKVGAP